MNYYIADEHFGHANIIHHSHRPFSSVEEMDKTLIDNWNSVVTDDDDVWIVGDLMYKTDNPKKYLEALKGKKHLIVGNHDKYIKNPGYRKYFVSIDDYKRIQDGKYQVVLFHYPIAEWDGYYNKHVDVIHLFGHIHNNENEACKTMKERRNCYNVGSDLLGFTPRTLEQIIKIYSNS